MGESVTTPIRKASFRDENFLLPVPKSANSTNVIGDRQLAPLASITTKSQVDQCPEKQLSHADNSPISFDESSGKEVIEIKPQEKPRLMGRPTLKRVGKAFSCSGIMAQRKGLSGLKINCQPNVCKLKCFILSIISRNLCLT